jgi:tRNA threonylcarbamoyl adenosine modification protein (Sua5/YciO/YrdC/YwlC family)
MWKTMWKTIVAQAIKVVKNGELIVFPTDTVYGVGVVPYNKLAIKKLLLTKNRTKTLSILCSNTKEAFNLGKNIPNIAQELANKYWPGQLTMVLQKNVDWFLGDIKNTIAVRVPNNKIAFSILKETGPLAVSSANKNGETPASTYKDAHFSNIVSYVVDGGDLPKREASTIISFEKNKILTLRQGVIKI